MAIRSCIAIVIARHRYSDGNRYRFSINRSGTLILSYIYVLCSCHLCLIFMSYILVIYILCLRFTYICTGYISLHMLSYSSHFTSIVISSVRIHRFFEPLIALPISLHLNVIAPYNNTAFFFRAQRSIVLTNDVHTYYQ